MKRFLCIVLTLLLIVAVLGCKKSSEDFREPANFYYPSTSSSFFENDSVIAPEVRETVEHKGNILNILNMYLQGPVSDNFSSPFPAGLKVISAEYAEETLVISFSEQFSSLSDLDLTIACSCICATVADLTGCKTVEIMSEGTLPDNTQSLVFSFDDLMLLDNGTW